MLYVASAIQPAFIRPVGLGGRWHTAAVHANEQPYQLALTPIDGPREHYVLAFNTLFFLSLSLPGVLWDHRLSTYVVVAVWWENFVCQNKSLRNRA